MATRVKKKIKEHIAIIAAVMSMFKVLVVQILAGFIVMIPLMLISYSFIGNKYRKKMKK